jgi:hypothetical protein
VSRLSRQCGIFNISQLYRPPRPVDGLDRGQITRAANPRGRSPWYLSDPWGRSGCCREWKVLLPLSAFEPRFFHLQAHSLINKLNELLLPYSDWLRAGLPRDWSSSPGRVKNFLLSMSSRPTLGPTQPPLQCIESDLFPRVRRLEQKADNLLSASAEIKEMWIYASTTPYTFMA